MAYITTKRLKSNNITLREINVVCIHRSEFRITKKYQTLVLTVSKHNDRVSLVLSSFRYVQLLWYELS